MKLKALWAGATMAAALMIGGGANATTVDFTIWDGTTAGAIGAFTYATGDTGLLGYSDLSAFSVTLFPSTPYADTYTLSDIPSLLTNQYFGYATDIQSFLPPCLALGNCNAEAVDLEILAAFGGDLGFVFEIPGNIFGDFRTSAYGTVTNVTYSVVGVPEPATWAISILGIAMIGFAARRRSARQRMA